MINTKNKRERIFLSIVFSFFNEESVLRELISRVRVTLNNSKHLSGYELIFVNDSSTDGSEKILLEEIKNSKDIVLVNMSRNFGTGECVYAGFSVSRGDAVVYMDSDLQDPPELINELVEEFIIDEEVQVVYTTRKSRRGEGRFKLLVTSVAYKFIKYISNIEIPTSSGDFKLLSRRVVDLMLKYEEKLPYIRGLVSFYGFKQKQVFYDRDPRFDGAENTKYPFLSKRMIDNNLDKVFISFSDVPLKITLYLGFFIAVLAFIYLFFIIFQYFLGQNLPGWSAVMASILILGGVQLSLIGFLGLYINQIFLGVKNRPNYVIEKIIRNQENF
jgi:dolichol-phosphate mannosyltransferase